MHHLSTPSPLGVARSIVLASPLLTLVTAQHVGTEQAEIHPPLKWQKCTAPGSCSTVNGEIVIDANWRWAHDRAPGGYKNCYDGNRWDPKLCPNNKACAENCALDGAGNLDKTYGISTKNDSINMKFTNYVDFYVNYGSRVFLMANENKYQMFTLLGNEFTFDVDASQLACGINGALSFVAMDEDGGMARYPTNKAGAKYGTGYCDSQCPRHIKWINGQANSEGWEPSQTDPANGVGNYGSCCPEVNVWDANAFSTSINIHPCLDHNQQMCKGEYDCGFGQGSRGSSGDRFHCDYRGCDFNPYRHGAKNFYGPGSNYTIDSTKKVTVVTQFVPGETSRDTEIRRFYVQGGKVVANAASTAPELEGSNKIDSNTCLKQKMVFDERDAFQEFGEMPQMTKALQRPMVLSLSILDDHYANMLWLDGERYPIDRDSSDPGVARGTCSVGSGDPAEVRSRRDALTVSNIKFGPINSTFPAV